MNKHNTYCKFNFHFSGFIFSLFTIYQHHNKLKKTEKGDKFREATHYPVFPNKLILWSEEKNVGFSFFMLIIQPLFIALFFHF